MFVAFTVNLFAVDAHGCPREDPIQQDGTLHDDHSTTERPSSVLYSIPEPMESCVFISEICALAAPQVSVLPAT